jgi:hypothetical protein
VKTCEDCGGRVYALGCVNCNEAAYIALQADDDDDDGYCNTCLDGTVVSDTCDECDERHCPDCEPCT